MKVIIAEKPSVAKNIADALKIKKRSDGYFEGEGYLITWAFGHLLELFDAKDYDEKMAIWRMENFPFIPEKFEYKVKIDRVKKKVDAGAKKQLNCIKTLINRKDVEAVISACDYDREGQVIGDIILAYLKVKKPIYRILLNEWTEEEVQKGIDHMVLNKELKPLQDAGISRQQADWLIGINLTSVATLKYKSGKGELFNIGRVLLPTLKMIYDRDMEIDKFDPEPYHKLTAIFSKESIVYEGTYTEDKKEKFEKKEVLEAVKLQLAGKPGIVTDKEVAEKNEYPQPLFNLSALQGHVTSKYSGFTSDKVLKVAQSLYEKKYITYPRTASSVLDDSLVDKTKKVLYAHKKGLPYEEEIIFKKSPRVFNSKKVESHSAIMPTYVIPKGLGGEEELVYTAIRNRFLMQFMPVAKVEETVITTSVEGLLGAFLSKGKVQKELGWKKIENDTGKDVILPDVAEGMRFDIAKADITDHATTPPKPYTEKTLLRSMETCGKAFKEDNSKEDGEDLEMMDAILSGFSIGTPATRAETIKKLCYTGYTVMQRKNIRCTVKGKSLIEALPVKELMDLEYTGKLEKTLSDIEKGSVAKEEFMDHIKDFVNKAVQDIRSQRIAPIQSGKPEGQPKDSGATTKGADKSKTGTKTSVAKEGAREILGQCPHCGADVVEGTKGFGCLGFKSGCKYVVWKEDEMFKKYGKKVTKTVVKNLLKKGEATVKGFKTPSGTKFDAIVKYIFDHEMGQGSWEFRRA
ncbi:MAG: DNA topoisomerase [Cellulosilyticaceae bacterium]